MDIRDFNIGMHLTILVEVRKGAWAETTGVITQVGLPGNPEWLMVQEPHGKEHKVWLGNIMPEDLIP